MDGYNYKHNYHGCNKRTIIFMAHPDANSSPSTLTPDGIFSKLPPLSVHHSQGRR